MNSFYNITGLSSAGKAFLMENYRNYFENAVKGRDYPENIQTRNPSFILIEKAPLTSYIFLRKGNRFSCFNPLEDNKKTDYLGNRPRRGNVECKIITEDYPEIINGSHCIFLVRDPRVVWLVDDHYDQRREQIDTLLERYISEVDEIVNYYEELKKLNVKIFVLRFEDYQNNFDYVTNQINNFLELENPKIFRSSLPANYWISNLDYWTKIYKANVIDQIVRDDVLDFISKNTKTYNNIFGYSDTLYRFKILSGLDMNYWKHFGEKYLK